MNEKFKQLQKWLDKQYALQTALILLDWDNSTEAPKAAIDNTSKAISILASEAYTATINDEVRSLLEELKQASDLTDFEAGVVKELSKDYDELSSIPQEEYTQYSQLLAKSPSIWTKARSENDFSQFAPTLEQLIKYTKQFAAYMQADGRQDQALYDIQLNKYEEGFNMEILDDFFARLRSEIVPLLQQIIKKNDTINKDFNSRSYPIESQRAFNKMLAEHIGFDFQRGVIKESVHPFTTNLHNKDVRITTAYHENNLESAMFSTIHEGGHALYEMHIDDAYTCSPVGGGASMGMHESQSRLFENNLGRSRQFWLPLWDRLKETYPTQLEDISLEDFIRGINKSQPGLIRTEADELTYCLHIMMRYEIEKMIFSEDIAVDRLPQIWNDKYEEYLGIRPDSDRDGILQDIHWANGSFGYFPSYAIGSAVAAQIYVHLKKVMDLDALLSEGNFDPINEYLRQNVHRFGKLKNTNQVLMDLTGESFNPEYYIHYLKEKYTALYNL